MSRASSSARRIPPSMPLIPAAGTPFAMSRATSVLLARPASTASATSRVGASVTRRPRSKRVSRPSFVAHSPTSGPPPWTTTSGRPASFSDATRSSAASSSAATLPPIFRTTASRPLGGVVGIDPHVLRGEIRAPRPGGRVAEAEVHHDRDLGLLEDRPHPGGVEWAGRALLLAGDPADADRRFRPLDLRARATRRGEDAAPVRVRAVDGGLHEVRGRDRPRRDARVAVTPRPSHAHLTHLPSPPATLP